MADDGLVRSLQSLLERTLHLAAPSPATDLVADGVLDSLGLVTLLFEIEQEYGVQIPLETLDLEDIRTLDRLAEMIRAQVVGCNGTRPSSRVEDTA